MNYLCAICRMKKGASGLRMRLCLLAGDNLLDMYTHHGQVTPEIARPPCPVAALRFLAIDWLLRVIAPCHETRMTHPSSGKPIRDGYNP
ncbi:MAG: hypothetical protein ABFS45_13445 [Pseudomonadota bacterium]